MSNSGKKGNDTKQKGLPGQTGGHGKGRDGSGGQSGGHRGSTGGGKGTRGK